MSKIGDARRDEFVFVARLIFFLATPNLVAKFESDGRPKQRVRFLTTAVDYGLFLFRFSKLKSLKRRKNKLRLVTVKFVSDLLGEPKIRRFSAEAEVFQKKRLAEAEIFVRLRFS